ncbi:MAG: Holliday junction branch migration DNA helicase RuvB [Deltaproteobacteria bacterium]|nr:MAG: Holliday junction branch migration DNA helicase RuvB [Deltaproteobacteria bacterium]
MERGPGLREERGFEKTRPLTFRDYIGQERIKENLKVYVDAAKRRGEALDHVLFFGPPGLGKTTLAYVIAHEMGVGIRATSGPAIERPGDLAAILTNLQERDVLFIDEIHRLSKPIEEALYPALEEFKFDIVIGQGPGARAIRLELPRFTLIGATTRVGLLSSPLRARFGVLIRVDYYSPEELEKIVQRAAALLDIRLEEEGAREIALCSRGTPRVALRLLKRVRDYAQVKGDGVVTGEIAREALSFMEIDSFGLDRMDRAILRTIVEKFGGGPVGIDTLSAALSEERDTIEDVYEPFLIQMGYIHRTPRGRVATRRAYEYLGISPQGAEQKELF